MAWTNKKTAVVIGVGMVAILAILLTAVLEFQVARTHRSHHSSPRGLSPISKKVIINVQLDGTVTFQATIGETNATHATLRIDSADTGSKRLTRITDDSGNPMKFIKQGRGYFITFNQPVPRGETVSYTVEGQVTGFINPNKAGICRVGFESIDGNVTDMHCVQVWRLPVGATLLEKNSELAEGTNAGQIELRFDKIVPPNGPLKLAFSYRLPPNPH